MDVGGSVPVRSPLPGWTAHLLCKVLRLGGMTCARTVRGAVRAPSFLESEDERVAVENFAEGVFTGGLHNQ